MATYRAIRATCEAVVELLRQSWQTDLFTSETLTFGVYNAATFDEPTVTVGASLFLYRVTVSDVQRSLPAPPTPGGPRRRQLPLDLHFILTPWAETPAEQLEILGWAMRTLEDTPVLPRGLLNMAAPGTFDEGEVVEVVPEHLTHEELFRVWDGLPGNYQLSAPYVARVVRIDSLLDLAGGGPVLTRELDFGDLKDQ